MLPPPDSTGLALAPLLLRRGAFLEFWHFALHGKSTGKCSCRLREQVGDRKGHFKGTRSLHSSCSTGSFSWIQEKEDFQVFLSLLCTVAVVNVLGLRNNSPLNSDASWSVHEIMAFYQFDHTRVWLWLTVTTKVFALPFIIISSCLLILWSWNLSRWKHSARDIKVQNKTLSFLF